MSKRMYLDSPLVPYMHWVANVYFQIFMVTLDNIAYLYVTFGLF